MLVVLKRLLRGGLAEERLEEGMGAWGRGGPGTGTTSAKALCGEL